MFRGLATSSDLLESTSAVRRRRSGFGQGDWFASGASARWLGLEDFLWLRHAVSPSYIYIDIPVSSLPCIPNKTLYWSPCKGLRSIFNFDRVSIHVPTTFVQHWACCGWCSTLSTQLSVHLNMDCSQVNSFTNHLHEVRRWSCIIFSGSNFGGADSWEQVLFKCSTAYSRKYSHGPMGSTHISWLVLASKCGRAGRFLFYPGRIARAVNFPPRTAAYS